MSNSIFFLFAAVIGSLYTQNYKYKSFPKIDSHVHIETVDESFIKVLKKNNFRVITIITDYGGIDRQYKYAVDLYTKYPDYFSFLTTFSVDKIDEPNWKEETINWLQKCFDAGAIGVKVWKNIGMVQRNKDGSFMMIDDPRLEPIFDYIESKNKTVLAHIGEPKNCWLPIEDMTVRGDSLYYSEHPQYHMYNFPGYPTHSELIAARDRLLGKHPNLTFVGAHLGSLEWDVDEIAKRLDKYPNFYVDMAARVTHFKVQDQKKVYDFLVKYQDRLLYATDLLLIDGKMEDTSKETLEAKVEDNWMPDWKYFSTGEILPQQDKIREYKGLNLPQNVLEKIYFKNTIKVFPDFK